MVERAGENILPLKYGQACNNAVGSFEEYKVKIGYITKHNIVSNNFTSTQQKQI